MYFAMLALGTECSLPSGITSSSIAIISKSVNFVCTIQIMLMLFSINYDQRMNTFLCVQIAVHLPSLEDNTVQWIRLDRKYRLETKHYL